MLKNILNKLEHPEYPLLGPNIKLLEFWGLLLSDNFAKKCLHIFLNSVVILFNLTEWIDIWFVKHDKSLTLTNLKITILSTVTIMKFVTFLLWQKNWKSVMNYVTETDKIHRNITNYEDKNGDKNKKDIINNYTKYSRKITYYYCILMFTTVVCFVLQPIFKYAVSKTYRENVKNGTEDYVLSVSVWMPFDKNTLIGHIFTCLYIDYVSAFGSGWITSFDTTVIVMMVFFKEELEMLRIDSSKICNIGISKKEFRERLKNCHTRHQKLIKHGRLFNSCLSPIMLLYVIVCSLMLCVTVYQLNTETGVIQKFVTAEYLIFNVAQLFMYCWHCNEVFYVSKNLSRGPFHGFWWTKSVAEQRNISILVQQFNKVIFFSAGPFYSITVATFITILEGAYSYYTLLSKSQRY